MREIVPAPVSAAIAWDTIAREPGSFIDPELRDRHSDLLFSARLAPDVARATNPILLYLLLEHQSTLAADMPLRMLEYLVCIWKRYEKLRGLPLPLVLPVLVAHAPEGWKAPVSIQEMFVVHPESVPGLAAFVPHFSMLVDDLTTLTDEQLQQRTLAAFQKLALWALRDARDTPRLLRRLGRWVDLLRELMRAENGTDALVQLLRYIALVGGDVQFEGFRARIRDELPEAEDAAMTIAEQLRQEGMNKGMKKGRREGLEEGRQQGLRSGRLDLLRRLLALKFGELPPDASARLDAATLEQLDRWADRVLTAETLAAVLE